MTKKGIFRSLASRILLLAACLLVLPLFLHTLLLYWKEYSLAIEDAQEMLEMVGEGERAFLEERITIDWEVLQTVGLSPERFSLPFAMKEVAKPPQKKGLFVAGSPTASELWIGRELPHGRALVIPFSYEDLLQMFSHLEKAPFLVDFALRETKGPLLVGKVQPEDALEVVYPLLDTNIELVFSASKEEVVALYRKEMFGNLFSLLFFVSVVGGCLVVFLTRKIEKPFLHLVDVMARIGEGSMQARYSPDKMGFEIDEVGKRLNEMLDRFFCVQETLHQEKIERGRLAEELRIGREIQRKLLPKTLLATERVEMGAAYVAAGEVSGDFYDCWELQDGSTCFYVADTVGKGIGACLYALGLRSALRMASLQTTKLEEIVSQANQHVWRDMHQDSMFFTTWIGILDPKESTLTYCSQGHPPALLLRNHKILPLTTEGIALGVVEIDTLFCQKERLQPGDRLLLYTDGVLECRSPEGEWYGMERLYQFLHQSAALPIPSVLSSLEQDLERFATAHVPLHDDWTALILGVGPF